MNPKPRMASSWHFLIGHIQGFIQNSHPVIDFFFTNNEWRSDHKAASATKPPAGNIGINIGVLLWRFFPLAAGKQLLW